jgi:dTDP-4-amino-4,6-dideoxygalactose transaminase
MSEVAAAIGRVQLRHLDEYTNHQREIAKYYEELLTDIPPVTLPVEKDYAFHTFLRYVILVPKRDQLKEYLTGHSIQSKVLYDIPLHLDPRYMKTYSSKKGDYPITEKIKEEELALPMPRFRERWEIEYITEKIKTFYSSL